MMSLRMLAKSIMFFLTIQYNSFLLCMYWYVKHGYKYQETNDKIGLKRRPEFLCRTPQITRWIRYHRRNTKVKSRQHRLQGSNNVSSFFYFLAKVERSKYSFYSNNSDFNSTSFFSSDIYSLVSSALIFLLLPSTAEYLLKTS